MNDCYELCLKFIRKCSDLDSVMDKYSKSSIKNKKILEKDVNKIELEIFELKNRMKKINL